LAPLQRLVEFEFLFLAVNVIEETNEKLLRCTNNFEDDLAEL